MEKKKFIEKVLSMVHLSLEPSATTERAATCEEYSNADYDRFIRETMPAEEASRFETHCGGCLSCLKRIAKKYEALSREQDQSEDTFLFERTMELLDQIESQESKAEGVPGKLGFGNMFQIALEISRDVLNVIETTGELLAIPAAPAVRGEQEELLVGQALRILQEFAHPPISVQATIEKGEAPDLVNLKISLFDLESTEFMSNVEMTIHGPGVVEMAISDANGESTFSISGKGNYQIGLVSGGNQIAQLRLSLK